MKQQQVYDFWNKMAVEHGTEFLATTKCQTIKQLEIYALSQHLKNGLKILDVGCGNGLNILAFAKQFPKSEFFGIDNSPEMIKQAQQNAKIAGLTNVDFHVSDATSIDSGDAIFDVVMTDRCIINLLTEREQKRTIVECFRVLKPKGIFLMLENCRQTKDFQNNIRETYGLSRRPDAEHNLFIDEGWLYEYLQYHGKVEAVEDFGSFHDLILYVIAPLIRKKEPCYDDELVKKATELTMKDHEKTGKYMFGSMGQNRLWIVRKYEHDDFLQTANPYK